jgi:hypothetical protein
VHGPGAVVEQSGKVRVDEQFRDDFRKQFGSSGD